MNYFYKYRNNQANKQNNTKINKQNNTNKQTIHTNKQKLLSIIVFSVISNFLLNCSTLKFEFYLGGSNKTFINVFIIISRNIINCKKIETNPKYSTFDRDK